MSSEILAGIKKLCLPKKVMANIHLVFVSVVIFLEKAKADSSSEFVLPFKTSQTRNKKMHDDKSIIKSDAFGREVLFLEEDI
mgnify:CR=1 FL=1